MKFHEMKVGQIIKHREGFEAEVTKLIEGVHDSEWSDVHLKVTKKGDSIYNVGEEYVGLPNYCTLVKDVENNSKNSTNNNRKLAIDVEVNGLEKLEELTKLEKETTVFEAELGGGISFKGTKSDFETFIKGLQSMTAFSQELLNVKSKKVK